MATQANFKQTHSPLFSSIWYLQCKKQARGAESAQNFRTNPLTPLSRLNEDVCICVQNLIYVGAVQFWSASRENWVFFCYFNIRLAPLPPSIFEGNREASNPNEVHKSECDKPRVCRIPIFFRAVTEQTRRIDYSITKQYRKVWIQNAKKMREEKHLWLYGIEWDSLCKAELSKQSSLLW